MKINIRTILLTSLVSIGMGISSGIFIVFVNKSVASLFKSAHYITPQQSHHYTFGIVLAYSLFFIAVSLVQVFIKLGKEINIFYPLSGAITLFVACYIRGFEAHLGTFDCGSHCANTIAPQSAEDAATRLVIQMLVVLYVVFVALYTAKIIRSKKQVLTP